jgi:hypothetical protein
MKKPKKQSRTNEPKRKSNKMRFGAIALAALAAGCIFAWVRWGQEEAPKTPPQITSAAAPVAAAARQATPQEVALVPDGTQLYSPESGKPVRKSSGTPALVYGGRLYFLCCAVCMRKCQADPSLLKDAKPPNGYDLGKLTQAGP